MTLAHRLAGAIASRQAPGSCRGRRAPLAWTEAATLVSSTHISDDAFETARAQFDGKEPADLTIAIGLINAYNRDAISFRQGPAASHRQAQAR
jgi:alkylhydroperoxidase family enzyme